MKVPTKYVWHRVSNTIAAYMGMTHMLLKGSYEVYNCIEYSLEEPPEMQKQ